MVLLLKLRGSNTLWHLLCIRQGSADIATSLTEPSPFPCCGSGAWSVEPSGWILLFPSSLSFLPTEWLGSGRTSVTPTHCHWIRSYAQHRTRQPYHPGTLGWEYQMCRQPTGTLRSTAMVSSVTATVLVTTKSLLDPGSSCREDSRVTLDSRRLVFSSALVPLTLDAHLMIICLMVSPGSFTARAVRSPNNPVGFVKRWGWNAAVSASHFCLRGAAMTSQTCKSAPSTTSVLPHPTLQCHFTSSTNNDFSIVEECEIHRHS